MRAIPNGQRKGRIRYTARRQIHAGPQRLRSLFRLTWRPKVPSPRWYPDHPSLACRQRAAARQQSVPGRRCHHASTIDMREVSNFCHVGLLPPPDTPSSRQSPASEDFPCSRCFAFSSRPLRPSRSSHFSGVVSAQAPVKQMKLTEKQIEGFIAAHKDMGAVAEKMRRRQAGSRRSRTSSRASPRSSASRTSTSMTTWPPTSPW